MKKIILNIVSRLQNFTKENKKETYILILILLVASYMRLYNIGGYMTFLGDEGRDAIIVRRLLVDFDPILIGPGTSIGNMYLGPLYYYLMAPALLFANFSPVGPAVMIALLGVFTVWFVWYVVRVWFPLGNGGGVKKIHVGAMVAALLYAVSPTVIVYSRSSWNPNIMPFFSLLAVFSTWKFWKEKKYLWIVVAGISMAAVLQSHYLGLLLAPVIGVFWLLSLILAKKKKDDLKKFIRFSVLSFTAFSFMMSPLFIFDARHGWQNFGAMKVFFTERQTTVSAKPWNSLDKIWPLWQEINTRLVGGYNEQVGTVIAFVILAVTFLLVLAFVRKLIAKRRFGFDSVEVQSLLILASWIVFSLVGLGLYKQHIYDHYFGFVFALPYIALGGYIQIFLNNTKLRSKINNILLTVIFSLLLSRLLVEHVKNSPIKFPPNKQYERSVAVSQKMIDESDGKPFNIAVIAERNYEGAYQYHLERVSANFVIIDPQRASDTITEQLFVVCELPKEKCDPTHNGKAEVANFGWSKIEKEWEVFGVTLFKLVHSQNEENI